MRDKLNQSLIINAMSGQITSTLVVTGNTSILSDLDVDGNITGDTFTFSTQPILDNTDTQVLTVESNGLVGKRDVSSLPHTTGATLVGSTVYFDRTDNLSAYTLDLSTLDVNDTFVTGFTYDNNNNLTITRNDATSIVANITTFSGISVNGNIVSGGTNIERIFLRNISIDFAFDATYSTTSSSFASAPMTVVIQSASTYLNSATGISATLTCDISQSDSGVEGEFELFNLTDSTSVSGSQTSFFASDGLKKSSEFTFLTTDFNDVFNFWSI